MEKIIRELFSENNETLTTAEAVTSLWNDASTREIIGKEIGKKLLENKTVLDNHSHEQLMSIMSMSHFADSQEECCKVAAIIYWGINHPDIQPLVSKHKNRTLAYRCLISLGIFKSLMISLFNRGAPSPSFYRSVGINSFEIVGEKSISCHFEKWEYFLNEYFVLQQQPYDHQNGL